jgi:uncharacterized protein with PIN domain
MFMKLLVTDECVRVARWLRLMGYDAALAPARPLARLYRQAYNERRAIVTRNRHVGGGALIRVVQLGHTLLEEQLKQLMRELNLTVDADRAFSRCDRCNVELAPIEKAAVHSRVPPYVHQTQDAFRTCPSCHRIYWAATHWQRACRFFDRLRKEAGHA